MRTRLFIMLLIATLWGCGEAGPPTGQEPAEADDGSAMSLDGDEIASRLDGNLESEAFETPTTFARLGLMWDAPAPGAIELRASLDGAQWTEWQVPTETFVEEGSYAGHVDVPEGALHFQFRAVSADAIPSWVSFTTLQQIPTPVDEGDLTAEDEDDEAPPNDLEPLASAGTINIHSRAEWGARPPKCVASMDPNRVTIHHTVTPTNDPYSPQKRLRQIQAFHMYSQGWCDIGYNFLVSRDGRLWRGRGRLRLGAHVANQNSGNVGISFMGNYSSTKVNKAQRCNAARLLRWLHGKEPAIKLNRSDIKGHRQRAATACPGNALYNQLNAIVTLAREGGC